MKTFVVGALSAVIAAFASPVPADTSRPIVLGYYPSWESGLTPKQINYKSFTHLCHAFVTADTSGTLKTEGNLPSRELTGLAHRDGVKVLLSVGGMDSGVYLGPIAGDKARAARFVRDVTTLMVENGYDGVDLDWEFPASDSDREAFTSMARLFRAEFKTRAPGALLTSALSGTRWACRFVDSKALLPLLDFVSVMTYDVHGPWGKHAGHNAPLGFPADDHAECAANTVEGQMGYWSSTLGWPRNKLLVGIPCYGRGFIAGKWGDPTTRVPKAPHEYVPYKAVPAMLGSGWRRHWDAGGRVPWLSKPGEREVISYDDPQSAGIKGSWGAAQGYGGIFFWEISQDMADGRNAVVEAARQGWAGGAGGKTRSPDR